MHAMRVITNEVENKINWVEQLFLHFIFSKICYFKGTTSPPFHSNETVSYLLFLFFFSFFLLFGVPHVLPYRIEISIRKILALLSHCSTR